MATQTRRVLMASLIGTTIEFFDFYIYATAAVLVFPSLFFPISDPGTARLASFATFAVAFLARPLGSAVFGHYGDRVGRKATLVLSLVTMGVSTVAIGFLPTYASIGIAAPIFLALCRFGQGLGLGGEWSGAVLLSVEHAPAHKRVWYGIFPQLGAPLGLFFSSVVFIVLSHIFDAEHLLSFAWRLPFLASALLVVVGLYIRLALDETPVFKATLQRKEQLSYPFLAVFRNHKRGLIIGTLVPLSGFILFYLMSVFALSFGTTKLHYDREVFLLVQLLSVLFFAAGIPLGALFAKRSYRAVLVLANVAIFTFGIAAPTLFQSTAVIGVLAMMVGMLLVGIVYGLLGTALSALFPPNVRYTGSSIAFSFAGIFGASLAPSIATSLAEAYGLTYVGYYLCVSAAFSLLGLFKLREREEPQNAIASL